MGLAIVSPSGSSNHGLSAPTAVQATVTATASQITGRQRRESDRPVGNNSSGNTKSMFMEFQIQRDTQNATSGAGSDPGRA